MAASDRAPVILRPHQTAHFAKLMRVLEYGRYAFDLSMMGCGKTFVASAIAATFDEAVVLCPKNVVDKWEDVIRLYGLPVTHVITYGHLRGRKSALVRKALGHHSPTAELDRMCGRRTLVILDEFHNLKNQSGQFRACAALLRAVLTSRQGRALLLSGTPMDKAEQATHLFRLINVHTQSHLARSNPRTGVKELLGMADILTHCEAMDAGMTRAIFARHAPFNHHTDYGRCCFDLFMGVLKPRAASTMVAWTKDVAVRKTNLHLHLYEPGLMAMLVDSVRDLKSAVRYDYRHDTVDIRVGAFARMGVSLRQMEWCKVLAIERVARRELRRNPNCKVVVCLNFLACIRYLALRLHELRPLVVTGGVVDRVATIAEFQAPDLRRRVLIANTQVCATGMDLDDKDGRFPRVAFVSPSYHTINLHQVAHRFHRADTRSDSDVRLVFAVGVNERGLLACIARKAGVMKQVTSEHETLYAGEYPDAVEDAHPAAHHHAALKIQRAWQRCAYDPSHPACVRRLQREFERLSAD